MSQPIVVFDGECALCNGFVAWLVRHDKAARFRIAGSNGEVGRAVVALAGFEHGVTSSTTLLWDGTQGLVRSDAIIAIARQLPWPWRFVSWGRVVPRPWRDKLYRLIAARRSRVIAEDPACGVPPPELVAAWRARLATVDDVPHVVS